MLNLVHALFYSVVGVVFFVFELVEIGDPCVCVFSYDLCFLKLMREVNWI